MTSVVLHAFVFLLGTSTCLASLNLLNALSNITTRPLQELTTDIKDFIKIAAENGYHAEKHEVTTDDGYILTMFRIPSGINCTKKSPLLLVHGLIQSAEGFLDSGPEAPGFVLAEHGYDLWFTNIRGNVHSRKHVHLDPDQDSEFWKFSIDQIGMYDIPAIIDYVLAATGTQKLIYLGYSQGAGSFIIMNSEKPEYANKISLFIGLAPATSLYYTKSKTFRLLCETINALEAPLEAAGVVEVLSHGMPLQGALSVLCQVELLASVVCGLTAAALDAPHADSITPEIEKKIFKNFPAGTSTHNIAWYGQSLNNRKFVKFDYGSEKNMEIYGTPEPPEHNFKAVKVPTVIFHGLADHLVDRLDADQTVSQLPNVLEYVRLDPLWTHLDMSYSRYWRNTIFNKMKNYLDLYNSID